MDTPGRFLHDQSATLMVLVFNHALLLKARLELALTQEQAAAAAGVDVRTYRRYESGEVNDPRLGFSVRQASRRRIIERLSAELGVAEDELLVKAPSDAASGSIPTLVEDDGAPATVKLPATSPPSAAPERLWRPLYVHALQRARHFVGRDELLAQLSRWMDESDLRPDHRVVALVALGGTGKTAVVERFTASLGDSPRPSGLFAWSFYDDPRTESFLAQALAYFAPEGAESPPGDRLERLQAALRRGPPHLLVLDGLETVQAEGGATAGGASGDLSASVGAGDPAAGVSARAHGELNDPALRRLLCAIARGLGRTRALVTSRFKLTDLGPWEGSGLVTILLRSLTEEEGVSLLNQWGIRGSETALRELVARSGGHALSVAMIGSYVGAFLGGDPRRFEASPLTEVARDDALARRLHAVLSAYARALSREDRDLLARLSVFPSGVGEDALLEVIRAGGNIAGSLAGWTFADLARSLARLERLGLVFSSREGESESGARGEKQAQAEEQARGEEPGRSLPRGRARDNPRTLRISTHAFLREHFKGLLGVPPERIQAVERERLAVRLDGHPHGPPGNPELLDAYETLIHHALDAGRASEAYGIYARSMGGYGYLGLHLGDMSRGARIASAFAEGNDPRRMHASLSINAQAAVAYEWGLYAGALGDLAFARRCYEAHNDVAQALGDESALVTGLRTLSYTERLLGSLPAALLHIERSVAIAERACGAEHTARSAALMASILHDLGEVDASDEQWKRLRSLTAQPFARRGLWEAEHDIALGRLERARSATERNLSVCSRLDWGGHVAHCHAVLGLARVEDDPVGALDHLTLARRWAGATGEVEMVLRCHDLAARLALSGGRPADAAEDAEIGLHLAETCGFGLFRSRLATLVARCAAALDPRGPETLAKALAAVEKTASEDAWGREEALRVAGVCLTQAGEQERAREMLGEAAALRERLRSSA